MWANADLQSGSYLAVRPGEMKAASIFIGREPPPRHKAGAAFLLPGAQPLTGRHGDRVSQWPGRRARGQRGPRCKNGVARPHTQAAGMAHAPLKLQAQKLPSCSACQEPGRTITRGGGAAKDQCATQTCRSTRGRELSPLPQSRARGFVRSVFGFP